MSETKSSILETMAAELNSRLYTEICAAAILKWEAGSRYYYADLTRSDTAYVTIEGPSGMYFAMDGPFGWEVRELDPRSTWAASREFGSRLAFHETAADALEQLVRLELQVALASVV